MGVLLIVSNKSLPAMSTSLLYVDHSFGYITDLTNPRCNGAVRYIQSLSYRPVALIEFRTSHRCTTFSIIVHHNSSLSLGPKGHFHLFRFLARPIKSKEDIPSYMRSDAYLQSLKFCCEWFISRPFKQKLDAALFLNILDISG